MFYNPNKKKEFFATGIFPAFSPTNINQIAYTKGGKIYIRDLNNKTSQKVIFSSRFWQAKPFGQLSWSMDGKFIVFGRASGLTGYKQTFYIIDIENKRTAKFYEGYIKELQFMGW